MAQRPNRPGVIFHWLNTKRGRTKLRQYILDHLRDTTTSEKEAPEELSQLFAALAK